jgi:hypothetical protein
LLNQSIASKNAKKKKKHPKTLNQLETKKLSELRYVFIGVFKVKKRLKLNSPHHMEHFDIKINYFGGLNLSQRRLSFSKLEFDNLFSLLHPRKD